MIVTAVVVLYRPDREEFLASLSSYVRGLDAVFVLDNSEESDAELVSELARFPNVHYHAFGRNTGLSQAYNEGIRLSRLKNADWILFMNQDSTFLSNPLERYLKVASDDVALLCPRYSTFKQKAVEGKGTTEVSFAQTSGTFLSSKAIDEIGFFDENLFLEWVDVDYCMRLKKKGLRIFQVDDIVLDHRPGTPRTVRVLWKKVTYSSYSPLRKYYLVRGALYLRRKHHRPSLYAKARLKLWIKMYAFREKSLALSRLAIREAKKDFKKGFLGKAKELPERKENSSR